MSYEDIVQSGKLYIIKDVVFEVLPVSAANTVEMHINTPLSRSFMQFGERLLGVGHITEESEKIVQQAIPLHRFVTKDLKECVNEDIQIAVNPVVDKLFGYPFKELRPHRTYIEHKVHIDKY